MRAPSFFVALALAYPRLALPCSLAPGVETGFPQSISSPQPLLASEYDRQPSLTDEEGSTIPLEPAPTPSDLQGAMGVHSALTFYRPTAPLAPGFYRVDGRRFEVRSEAPTPPPGTRGEVSVYFADEDNLSLGCGDQFSCGPSSGMTIDLVEATLDPSFEGQYDHVMPTFLVSITGETFSRQQLVSAASGFGDRRVELRFYSAEAERFCLQVQAVSDQGVLGDTLDLGCVDPTDSSDPRVSGDPPGGCTSGTPRQIPLLGLLAAFWGLGWWRRQKV